MLREIIMCGQKNNLGDRQKLNLRIHCAIRSVFLIEFARRNIREIICSGTSLILLLAAPENFYQPLSGKPLPISWVYLKIFQILQPLFFKLFIK